MSVEYDYPIEAAREVASPTNRSRRSPFWILLALPLVAIAACYASKRPIPRKPDPAKPISVPVTPTPQPIPDAFPVVPNKALLIPGHKVEEVLPGIDLVSVPNPAVVLQPVDVIRQEPSVVIQPVVSPKTVEPINPIVESNGSRRWYKEQILHRVYGPAIEEPDGSQFWMFEGKKHRVDGPAVMLASGQREWWVDGLRHRADGPAVEYASGLKSWWFQGKRHRDDGPAVERPGGTKEWWVHGVRVLQRPDVVIQPDTVQPTSPYQPPVCYYETTQPVYYYYYYYYPQQVVYYCR